MPQSRAAHLIRLTGFTGANGRFPTGLTVDSAGDLFGATGYGGTHDQGTVFEIPKNAGGYAGAPLTLVNFNGANGSGSAGSPIIDANGNLFGATPMGGANDRGTVFEIIKIAGGYAAEPTILADFDGANGAFPVAGLTVDAAGNLFGTTSETAVIGETTIFEMAKTAAGYVAPRPISTFASSDTRLIIDPAGNLFGTRNNGHSGAMLEIPKIVGGNADAPDILVSLTDIGPAYVIADPSGNLLGTMVAGGAMQMGSVFEIAKPAAGQPVVLTPLAEFDGSNGANPAAVMIRDAEGNLFGRTFAGGANNLGTVFEIAKTATGYAAGPTVLASFDGDNGSLPQTGLVADAAGNLFGTTPHGGASDLGTVFEITGSGFVVPGTFAGTPGLPSCRRQSVLALTVKYGGLRAAAAVLGDRNAAVLRHKIAVFCAPAGSNRTANGRGRP